MKKLLGSILLLGVAGTLCTLSAQAGEYMMGTNDGSHYFATNRPPPIWTNVPPPTWTNTAPPRFFTNYISRNWTNMPPTTWTNISPRPTPPPMWTNSAPHSFSNRMTRVLPPTKPMVRPETGKISAPQQLPADVQALVQQFQQNRDALVAQLKNATEAQRKEILKQLEQLRTQMREQLAKLREDSRTQAEQMKGRFGNGRERLLNEGAHPPAGGTGTGGRDR